MHDEQFLTIPTPWVPQRTIWDVHVRIERIAWRFAHEITIPISDQMIHMANTFPDICREIEGQLICGFREAIRRAHASGD